MITKLHNIKKAITGEWRYVGITNPHMQKRTWKNSSERIDILFTQGHSHHSGYIVEVNSSNRESTLRLSNGFTESLYKALILADYYMRDNGAKPAAFMPSSSDRDGLVRQGEWLDSNRNTYDFQVIDPDEHRH